MFGFVDNMTDGLGRFAKPVVPKETGRNSGLSTLHKKDKILNCRAAAVYRTDYLPFKTIPQSVFGKNISDGSKTIFGIEV